MKQVLFAVVMAAAVFFTSCSTVATAVNGVTSNVSSTSTAYTNGSTAGAALKTLYSSYKTNGKVDLSNATNLLTAASLVSACQSLKGTTKGDGTYTNFATGLVAGSGSLVSNANTEAVMTLLSNLVGINTSALTSSATSAATTATTTASSTASTVASTATSVTTTATDILSLFE